MASGEDTNGWNEWSKHVLKELERLNQNYESLNNKIDGIRTDVHEEISDVRNDITKLKTIVYTVDEIKKWKSSYEDVAALKSINQLTSWKEEIDEIVSPTQLKELNTKVANHEMFKTKATTIFLVIQTLIVITFTVLNYMKR